MGVFIFSSLLPIKVIPTALLAEKNHFKAIFIDRLHHESICCGKITNNKWRYNELQCGKKQNKKNIFIPFGCVAAR